MTADGRVFRLLDGTLILMSRFVSSEEGQRMRQVLIIERLVLEDASDVVQSRTSGRGRRRRDRRCIRLDDVVELSEQRDREYAATRGASLPVSRYVMTQSAVPVSIRWK